MRRTCAALVALALVALLAAGPATAKPKGAKPKGGTFRLEIKGEQLTTWSYEKQMAPSCDFPQSEGGRQYISFETYRHGDAARPLVKVKRAPGGGVSVKFVRNDITISASARLKREYRTLYSQIGDCPGGEAGGESGGNVDAIGTENCRALGSLDVFVDPKLEEVENPYYPTDLGKRKAPKAALYFGADPYWLGSIASDHNLPSACEAEGKGDAAIGLDESQGEWAGAVVPVVGSLPANKLLGAKKKVVVELGRTIAYPNAVQTYAGPPHTKGKTRIDATLTFTPVR